MFSSPYGTLVLMWILFALVHSGLASRAAERGIGRRAGKYYRPFYSLLVLVMLILLVHHHFAAVETILWRPHWTAKILSALLLLPGLALIVVSLWKHLLPYSGLAALLGIETPQGFEKTGLHAYMRHPLYTGVLLFLWGAFIGYPYRNNLLSAVCFTLYFFIGTFFLERKLMAVYGDEYRAYRRRVPLVMGFRKIE